MMLKPSEAPVVNQVSMTSAIFGGADEFLVSPAAVEPDQKLTDVRFSRRVMPMLISYRLRPSTISSGRRICDGSGLLGAADMRRQRLVEVEVLDRHRPWGVGGRGAGPCTVTGDVELLPFRGMFGFANGDVIEWTSPAAAGYGDPLLRDPELVLTDSNVGSPQRRLQSACSVW